MKNRLFFALAFLFCAGEFFAPNLLAAADLSVSAEDLRLESGTASGPAGQGVQYGYHLFVRKKPDILSVLLTETTEDPEGRENNYAYRSREWNNVNGDEIRYLDGARLVSDWARFSIVDSTPQPDRQFGQAFHLFIPRTMVYGYPWARSGEVTVGRGTFVNIRAFGSLYADYSNGFADNPFMFDLDEPPQPQPQPEAVPATVPLPEPSLPSLPAPQPQPTLPPQPTPLPRPTLPQPAPSLPPQPAPQPAPQPQPSLPSLPTPQPQPPASTPPAPQPEPSLPSLPAPQPPASTPPAPRLPGPPVVVEPTPEPVILPQPEAVPATIPLPEPTLPPSPTLLPEPDLPEPDLPPGLLPEPDLPLLPEPVPLPTPPSQVVKAPALPPGPSLPQTALTDAYSATAAESFSKIAEAAGGKRIVSRGPVDIIENITGLLADAPRDEPLEIVFAIDTTGSMKDDLDKLRKEWLPALTESLSGFKQPPRLGLLLYRDYGDTFDTGGLPVKVFPFTTDLKRFFLNLNSVTIVGTEGGDVPEPVYEALLSSMARFSWTEGVNKKIILIGDAEPHPPSFYKTRNTPPYTQEDLGKAFKQYGIPVDTIILPDFKKSAEKSAVANSR